MGFVIVVLLLGGVLAYRYVVLPLRDVRQALSSLAAGDERHVIIRSSAGDFREISRSVSTISERLEEQKNRLAEDGFSLQAILSGMLDGVMLVDSQSRVRIANDALVEMFSLDRSPIGRRVIEVFRDHRLHDEVSRVLRERSAGNIEIDVTPAPGAPEKRKVLRVRAAPLGEAGEKHADGAIVVFHDVTQIRALEDVRREFVANVSHEFRTPLSIISGYVELLLDGALDDRAATANALRVMARHCRRLELLISDLLTIARLESRAIPLRFERTNMRELLESTLQQLEAQVAKHHASVEIDFAPDAVEADVDPGRFEQVYLNLLSNALQHGAKEDLKLCVRARRSGDSIEIAFSDNGPGIPYADQPHVFERFYRVRKDRSRDAGGTGLGLSIVKNVLQAHGGRVSLESTPGMGATFKVQVPAVRITEASVSPA